MTEKNLVQKLIHVQKELKAPKGQRNTFGNYNYRSAEDILEAVKPLNAEQGLLLTITDEPIMIGDWHYIKATATITDGNESHVITAFARESENKKGMDASQVTGATSSYARKYALNGLYLIDDTKDADTDEYQNKTQTYQTRGKPTNQTKQISSKQIGLIKMQVKKIAKVKNKTDEEVYQALKVKDVTKLTSNQASTAITTLNRWVEQMNEEEKQQNDADEAQTSHEQPYA